MTMAENEKVKEEVKKVFCMLASATGTYVGGQDLPQTELTDDSKQPRYMPANRTIIMPKKYFHSGIAYAEECSHALRDIAMRREGVPWEEQCAYVHEFFGRAGETICRYAAAGMDLKQLFREPARRIMPEERKKLADSLRRARRVRAGISSAYHKCAAGREYIRGVTQESQNSTEALVSQAENGEIGFDEFVSGMRALRHEYARAMEPFSEGRLMLFETDALQRNMHAANLKYLDCTVFSDFTDKEKKEALADTIKFFRESPVSVRFDLDDFSLSCHGISAGLEVMKHREHNSPYFYAQQYAAEELLAVYGLYSLTDGEVKKRFFRSRDRNAKNDKP